MFAGERLELYEFPVAPRDLASHALLRTLAAPRRAREGLHCVFADANSPPFAAGAFDTVVTPWLVDVIDADLAALAAVVNRLLAPGGRWLCTGTLFFGTSNRLDNLLDQFFHAPKVFILRMRLVPIIDASGVHALKALLQRCRARGIVVVVSGLQAQPRRVLERMDLQPRTDELYFVEDYEAALALAARLSAGTRPA